MSQPAPLASLCHTQVLQSPLGQKAPAPQLPPWAGRSQGGVLTPCPGGLPADRQSGKSCTAQLGMQPSRLHLPLHATRGLWRALCHRLYGWALDPGTPEAASLWDSAAVGVSTFPALCQQFWGEFLFLEMESRISGLDFWVRAQCSGVAALFGFPKEGTTRWGPAGQAEGRHGRGRSAVGTRCRAWGLPGAGPLLLLGAEPGGLRGAIHTGSPPQDCARACEAPLLPPCLFPRTTTRWRLGTVHTHSAGKETEAWSPPPPA